MIKQGDLVTPIASKFSAQEKTVSQPEGGLMAFYHLSVGAEYEVIAISGVHFPHIAIENDEGIRIGPLAADRFRKV